MTEVELSCLACVKMFLHASVYPRCSVNGLLLAPAARGGGVCEESVCVTDCVPLLHSHLPLAMISQLALTQVDVWCSQTQQRIVGYYQANANLSDSSPTSCAFKMADKILEQSSNAVLLMIDGKKMGPGYRVPPIVMYEHKDSRWTLKDKHTIMLRQWEEARAITAQLLNSRDCMLLVDFDSHLDDITKDWTNQKLNAKIMELICPANGNM
ncbi:ER membrane protein complex subunit 9 [Neoarius graeffei]|uniref:ER membrane protein complex subunit 9 n=1 Tax=Neoarius graeffei TaxID=443677 RepID=UPI00298C463B|nr:ER membrane protein complex subunit 9 [Neoarius graeffei]XP_060794729.1 ER membrane protein complex subunit 9 [Neoarius graeffei]XP_060794730.1 ER membrane protein complex subunit 9 [Neoarius graeffei]